MRLTAAAREARAMRVAILGSPSRTSDQLVLGWRALGVDASVLWPAQAIGELQPGDVAITRLDVLPTLDGVEPGLELVPHLETHGVRVLNRVPALLGTHDKLLTSELLEAAGVPHPRTVHVAPGAPVSDVPFPCVVKPRFGSWGQDVFRCGTREELDAVLDGVADRSWWRRHGALVQELVPNEGRDIRVVVAGGRAVAGACRVAAPGEWRTNVTLGGHTEPTRITPAMKEAAATAARAIGIDFTGVDLLPVEGRFLVLELNGAVDFDERYTLPGIDPFAAILDALDIEAPSVSTRMPDAGEGATMAMLDKKEETMDKTVKGAPAQPGDEILITGHAVGDAPKAATIVEVMGEPGHQRFRVRWEDGHESIFFPGDDAVIRHPAKKRSRAKA
jgi:RimK family alpha-L-glutamate ligase